MYLKKALATSALLVSLSLLQQHGNAVSVSRPVGNESRIRVINYVPNSVIRFVGHYNFHSIIEFGSDEEIKTITMGESAGWQLNPAGNRIFLKPVSENATTNMTVITNRRTYFFEMHAEHASGITDSNLAFITKFMYPDGQLSTPNAVSNTTTSGVDLSKPSQYNFKYTVSGKGTTIEPILIFDDGRFTYFKFKNINADIPTIFIVDQYQNEALINYRVADGYVIVERVSSKFTLRHAKEVICVFNEKYENFLNRPPKLSSIQGGANNSAAVMVQPGLESMSPQG